MAIIKEFEQRGYDAWIELRTRYNCSPTATLCPARYMQQGDKRSSYLKGWIRAKKEYEDSINRK